MKTIKILTAVLTVVVGGMFLTEPAAADQRHGVFTQLLQTNVDARGLVNYSAVCADPRLEQYTKTLSNTMWQDLNTNDQIAYWINAYNAFTLQVICTEYPVESISKLHTGGLVFGTVFNSTVWDREFFEIQGESMSLGHIEHEILRKGPEKARIHFAIVCAARSCPPLRQEAYEGYKLNEQLDDQGRAFLGRQDLNRFDAVNDVAYLSTIFKWFREDFGKNRSEMLEYISYYIPDESVRAALAESEYRWKIKWLKYDWSLNDQK